MLRPPARNTRLDGLCVSNRNTKAIFERQSSPLDNFMGEVLAWEEVAKAWVELDPVAILAQRQEVIEGSQTTGSRKSIAKTTWTPTLSRIDSACRMKVAKPVPVDANDLENDVNFRIFHIDAIVNVGELNRELQFMVVERV